MKLYVDDYSLRNKIYSKYCNIKFESTNDIKCIHISNNNNITVCKFAEICGVDNTLCVLDRKHFFIFFDLIEHYNVSFILTEEIDEQILAALLTINNGGRFVSRYFNNILKIHYFHNELSRRDLYISELIVKGYSYNEIAEITNLSYGTIRNYVSRLLSKLNVESKVQLALYFQKLLYCNK